MLKNGKNQTPPEIILKEIELPVSAYEKAETRYTDVGDWFDRDESLLKDFNTHIFPQGSFRLGTAIRPLHQNEEYDLDLACELRTNVSKKTHTQEQIKNMVGAELRAYRNYRGIKAPVESKHRCWRLDYQDEMSFHMDVVPCIFSSQSTREIALNNMRIKDRDLTLATTISNLSVSITDDRDASYKIISDNWKDSNPEGYAKWFETKMRIASGSSSETVAMALCRAQVDKLPIFQRKSILQGVIQILKRHRDQMFTDNQDSKPISIIITTLAARAYEGEQDLESALKGILSRMGRLVNNFKPRIPNPTNSSEDFADRWSMPQYKDLFLENNFFHWLTQAQADFENLRSRKDTNFVEGALKNKFSINISKKTLETALGVSVSSVSVVTPKSTVIAAPARPWRSKK